jgi:hypothetical protein
MSEDDGARSRREALYNLDRILDVHTHLTGREGESAESILKCVDFCGMDKVFLFAPMLDVGAHQITSDSLEDIRTHDDYCADLCSKAPERLLGFCTLNPMPVLADGDLGRAVGLMVEEAERCYHELGLGGWRDRSNPLVSTRPCARPVVANTGAAGHVHRLPLRHLLRRSPEHLL